MNGPDAVASRLASRSMRPHEARRFSFFALIDALERLHKPATRVGTAGSPSGEIIRFSVDPSLSFPTADVLSIDRIRDKPPLYEVTISFLGLLGTVSPLPLFYTEDILQGETGVDSQLAFLNIFHHRISSLFFRAWLKYRYLFQFGADCQDSFSRALLGMIGFTSDAALKSVDIEPSLLIRYAGLFYLRPRSASALESILRDACSGIRVRVQENNVSWVGLGSSQRFAPGVSSSSLGRNTIIGTRVRGCSSTFCICLGPLTRPQFLSFLPDQDQFAFLVRLIRLFVVDHLTFSFELCLRHDARRFFVIGTPGPYETGSRLGWNTWLAGDQTSQKNAGIKTHVIRFAGVHRRRNW